MAVFEVVRSHVAYVKSYSSSISPSIRAERIVRELEEAGLVVPAPVRPRVFELLRSHVAYVKSYSSSISPSIRAERIVRELESLGCSAP